MVEAERALEPFATGAFNGYRHVDARMLLQVLGRAK